MLVRLEIHATIIPIHMKTWIVLYVRVIINRWVKTGINLIAPGSIPHTNCLKSVPLPILIAAICKNRKLNSIKKITIY